MEDLKSLDFDLELTGFGEEELARILEPTQIEGLTNPDLVPDLPDNPVSLPGDLWILGKHRLLCGDSTFGPQRNSPDFFKPVQFALEPTDLLVQLIPEFFVGRFRPGHPIRKNLRQLLEGLFLPLRHLVRMDLVSGSNLVDRPLSLDCFQCNSCLDRCLIPLPLFGHLPPPKIGSNFTP